MLKPPPHIFTSCAALHADVFRFMPEQVCLRLLFTDHGSAHQILPKSSTLSIHRSTSQRTIVCHQKTPFPFKLRTFTSQLENPDLVQPIKTIPVRLTLDRFSIPSHSIPWFTADTTPFHSISRTFVTHLVHFASLRSFTCCACLAD